MMMMMMIVMIVMMIAIVLLMIIIIMMMLYLMIDTLHNSSLVLDESRSKINFILSKNIKDGKYKYLNLLGVDNVCDSGLEIISAIQQYFY